MGNGWFLFLFFPQQREGGIWLDDRTANETITKGPCVMNAVVWTTKHHTEQYWVNKFVGKQTLDE